MNKSILLLAIFMSCLHLAGFSQKTRAGVQGGPTFSKMTGVLDGRDNDYEVKVGYSLGMVVDAPINNKFSFYPGAHYVQKGTLQRPPMGTLITKAYVALRYAELNLNVIYKANGTKGNFFVGAGPSVSFNLPSKIGTMIDKDKTERDVAFGNTIDKDINGVDYGANFLLGYRLASGFYVTGTYNMGIRDIRPEDNPGSEAIKTTYFSLQIGWLLHNKAN